MGSKIKNILIFVGIAVALVLVYIYVFKKSPKEPSLVSTTGTLNTTTTTASDVQDKNSTISKDFLTVLLNVRNIKIDDAIFSDTAFLSLRDSTIELISDGNEGRPNPFAPLGTDTTPVVATPSVNNLSPITETTNTTTTTTSTTPVAPSMPTVGNSGAASATANTPTTGVAN